MAPGSKSFRRRLYGEGGVGWVDEFFKRLGRIGAGFDNGFIDQDGNNAQKRGLELRPGNSHTLVRCQTCSLGKLILGHVEVELRGLGQDRRRIVGMGNNPLSGAFVGFTTSQML